MKRSGSGVHVFQLAFEHMEDILNTDFKYVCLVAYSGHLCFCYLTKPAITIAGVNRFY